MKFLVRRFGTKEGVIYRGGIWFEIISTEQRGFLKSYYRYVSLTNSSLYQEYDKKFYYALVNVENPYFFDVSKPKVIGEAVYPVALYAQLFSKPLEEVKVMFRKLKAQYWEQQNPNELAYKKIEGIIASKLKKKGYDAVIFVRNIYDEVLFNYGNGNILDKDQMFYFGNNVEWLD